MPKAFPLVLTGMYTTLNKERCFIVAYTIVRVMSNNWLNRGDAQYISRVARMKNPLLVPLSLHIQQFAHLCTFRDGKGNCYRWKKDNSTRTCTPKSIVQLLQRCSSGYVSDPRIMYLEQEVEKIREPVVINKPSPALDSHLETRPSRGHSIPLCEFIQK